MSPLDQEMVRKKLSVISENLRALADSDTHKGSVSWRYLQEEGNGEAPTRVD